MADYDVKVGVSAVGDPSGAKQVDQAIQQVGQTAQQVAQQTAAASSEAARSAGEAARGIADGAGEALRGAAEAVEELNEAVDDAPASSGLTDGINGLDAALKRLSPEKAKGAVNGLTTAIDGLASGDTSRGLQGLSTGLFALAGAIPNPLVASAAAVAIGALAAAWKSFSDTSGVSQKLNEFGETVKQEQERLERLGETELEWQNLKASFSTIKDEFGKAQKLADTLGDTILKVFNRRYDTQINALRDQLNGANGDPSRTADINRQLSQKEAERAIVNNTVAVDKLTQQVKANVEAAQLELQMIERKRSEAEAAVAEMEALRVNVRGAGMSEDMLYSSGSSEELRTAEIQRITQRIAAIEEDVRRSDARTGGGPLSLRNEPPRYSDEQRSERMAEADGLIALKAQLLDFDRISQQAAGGQRYLNETIIEDQSAMQQHLADTVAAAGEQAAAIGELNRSMEGVAPSISSRAQDMAQALIALQVGAEATIEQGVMAGRSAEDLVRELSSATQKVVGGLSDAATSASSQIDILTNDLAAKKQTLAQLEAEIAAAPSGAAEAALADKWALAEEIDRLTQEVADATARSAEQASSSQRSQEAAAEKVGDGLAYVGKTVAAEGEATSAQVSESADKMSAEPVREAIADMAAASADLSAMENATADTMLANARMWRQDMEQALSEFRLGASGYREAAADFGSAGIEIARSVGGLTRLVSQLSSEIGSMRGDLGLLESQIRNIQ